MVYHKVDIDSYNSEDPTPVLQAVECMDEILHDAANAAAKAGYNGDDPQNPFLPSLEEVVVFLQKLRKLYPDQKMSTQLSEEAQQVVNRFLSDMREHNHYKINNEKEVYQIGDRMLNIRKNLDKLTGIIANQDREPKSPQMSR